ncbi:uncharacterized protein LOC143099748 [Alosa pseudoharengus]|uniref:uncharacterized protein LOC143099748 n=1 Tax=Alosa pseudoharengus TaxID=34774 RepID=UPI003F887FD6
MKKGMIGAIVLIGSLIMIVTLCVVLLKFNTNTIQSKYLMSIEYQVNGTTTCVEWRLGGPDGTPLSGCANVTHDEYMKEVWTVYIWNISDFNVAECIGEIKKTCKPYYEVTECSPFIPLIKNKTAMLKSSNSTLQFGDMLVFFRPGYQHWAVYVGKGKITGLENKTTEQDVFQITLLNGDRCVFATLEEAAKPIFFKASKWAKANYLDGSWLPQSQQSMKDSINRLHKNCSYDLLEHNCEHVATDIRYGIKNSAQVWGKRSKRSTRSKRRGLPHAAA